MPGEQLDIAAVETGLADFKDPETGRCATFWLKWNSSLAAVRSGACAEASHVREVNLKRVQHRRAASGTGGSAIQHGEGDRG